MESLVVTYSKIILSTLNIPIPDTPKEIVELASTKSFNLYDGDVVVVDQVNVHEILKELIKAEQVAVTPDYTIGMAVRVDYKGTPKEGNIKGVGYQVEGCGNKFYKPEEIERM